MDTDSTDFNDQFTMKPKRTLTFRKLGHMIICFFVGFLLGLLVFRRIEDALDYRSCPKMKPENKNYGGFQTIFNTIKTFGRADLIANENVLLHGRENNWEISNWKERSLPEVSDNFLFVGIMTARKFLDTRAMASHRTWVPRIPGKVVYFLGEGEEYTGDLNVVILKGVKENDYPPQKKSFAMVEYMAEHYAKHYKWLIRADDDVYMKVDDLVLFLQSINDTTPRYLGQPGFGKPVEEGKLGLSGAFCMGGPGVIMTNQVVRAVAPALKECLKLTVTGHEDTELGRCITISTGIQCTTAFEMKHLFYQNYQELDQPNSSFKKALGVDERRALTLHPVKEARYVFRMHNFFNNDTLQELERKKNRIRKQIMQLDIRLDKNKKQIINLGKIIAPEQDDLQPDPSLSAFMQEAVSRRPEGATSVNLDNIPMLPEGKSVYHGPDKTWEFIRYKRLFSTTIETGKIDYPMEYRLRPHLHDAFLRTVKNFPDFRKSPPHFVNQTYHMITANRGAEALLFLKRRHQNRQYIQPLFLRRPFHDKLVDFRESDSLDEDKGSKGKKLYLLMPLYQRSSIYKRFLDMFNRVIAGYDGKVQLRVVVFIDDRGEHKLISAATYAMVGAHPHLDIRMNYLDEPFNRGRGLMTALADLPYGSLLLFMDVDMEFSTQFLYRVSKHTVLGKSAFFPIYFVHYNPESICYRQEDCDTLLDSRRDEVGMWRSFSYGIGSVYKKDLIRAGGFKTNIVGWGLEDVDFYEKCLVAGLEVLRGSDAGMIHRYHPRECNTSLPAAQLIQCQDSGNAMLGSVANLYTMLSDVSHGQE